MGFSSPGPLVETGDAHIAGIGIYGLLITRFKLEAWQDVREMALMVGGPRSRLIRFLLENNSRVKTE